MAPQALALYEELTGRENLAFFGRIQGLRGRELPRRVEEALAFVGLSGGALQRAIQPAVLDRFGHVRGPHALLPV